MELKGSQNKILSIFSLIWILNILWKLTWKVFPSFIMEKRNFILIDSEIFYNRKCSYFTKPNRRNESLNKLFFFLQWTYLFLIELLSHASLGIKIWSFKAIENLVSKFSSLESAVKCPKWKLFLLIHPAFWTYQNQVLCFSTMTNFFSWISQHLKKSKYRVILYLYL